MSSIQKVTFQPGRRHDVCKTHRVWINPNRTNQENNCFLSPEDSEAAMHFLYTTKQNPTQASRHRGFLSPIPTKLSSPRHRDFLRPNPNKTSSRHRREFLRSGPKKTSSPGRLTIERDVALATESSLKPNPKKTFSPNR